MSEEEIDAALDEIEEEHGFITGDEPEFDELLEKQKKEGKALEKPPGFLTHDEWIAAGKDPADFRGEKAYKAQYDSLKEIRDLKGTMNQVVQGVESWKQQQNEIKAQEIEEAKNQAIADLAKAEDDEDIKGALAAKDKINSLDKQTTVVQTTQVNPIITDFTSKNPIIDPANTQYDAEFHQDMIMIHNSKLDQLLGGDRTRANELTQAQIERVQVLAFNQAKELHQDKFKSPKNKRTTSASPTKTVTKGVDVVTKLKSVEGNPRNPRDTTPAKDIYEYILEKDPAAAKIFAENVTVGE